MFEGEGRFDLTLPADLRREVSALVRFGLTLIYFAILIRVYIGLSPWWFYFGFNYSDPGLPTMIAVSTISSIPSILVARGVFPLSKFVVWMIFYLVYIPSSIIPYLQSYLPESSIILNHVLLLFSSFLIIFVGRMRTGSVRYIPIKPQTFWVWITAAYISMNLYLVVVFGSTLAIASFDTVYDQRFLGAAALGGSYVGYAIGALSNAVNPFLVAVGFSQRRWVALAAGIIGQLIAFSTLALRATILSPIFIILIVMLFKGQQKVQGVRLLAAFVAAMAFCVPFMASYNPIAGGMNEIVTLISMRTLLIPGMTFGVYADFFSIYPLTYLSHANIFNLFIDYPYGTLQLPEIVGQYIAPALGNEVLGFNASFLATEGIASFGSIGIVLSSLFMIVVMRTISRFLQGAPINILAACFIPFIVNLSNSSILTSLVTGGGVALTLVLYFWICSEQHAASMEKRA